MGRSLDQSLTLRALEQALAQHTPEIHHSDQGVQYAATAYTARLQAAGVQISMAEGYSSRKERRKTARLLMRKFEINCARRPIAIHSLLTTEHFVYNLMGAVQVTMGYTLIPLYTSPCVTTVK